jgi:nicotinate-nucleotide--dimethylbenzimidazole phosphoribosyltransferase
MTSVARVALALAAPSAQVRQQAAARAEALAKPIGALGDLEALGIWLSACQGVCPPTVPANVRAVVFAGDHGVSLQGVSAYPREVTPAMVRTILSGGAGISVLARLNDVHLRVLDIAVDDDLAGLPDTVSAYKIRRSSGAINVQDACTAREIDGALAAGTRIAREEIEAGADLLIVGDLGIGNTTPAAALIAAVLGVGAGLVTGRGTGVDDAGLARKRTVIDAALARTAGRGEPADLLSALGSADFAVAVGFLTTAAAAGVPVLLDGVIAVAQALLAERMAPGAAAWFAAGSRSPEPAQSLALAELGVIPLLDLGMRLGEGTGAVAAVPLVRAAAALLGQMALLADLRP